MKQKSASIDITGEAGASFAFDTLSFAEPKNVSKDTCICAATLKGKADGLVIRMPAARVVRVSLQKGSATVQTRVNRAAIRFIMGLDERCLASAMANASEWFMHKVKSSLIEDFFRPSTEVTNKTDGSVVARFKLAISDEDLVPNILEGQYYDLGMKLVGLQFRKQHFCALWKLVALGGADAASVPGAALERLSFIDDSDDEMISGICDDDVISQITQEDIRTMVSDIDGLLQVQEARLAEENKRLKSSLASVKSMKQRLSDAVKDDKHISNSNLHSTMRVLNTLSEELSSLSP